MRTSSRRTTSDQRERPEREDEHDEKKGRMGKLLDKSASFHIPSSPGVSRTLLRRPKTDPNLLSFPKLITTMKITSSEVQVVVPVPLQRPMTKLLLNVSIQRSLGAVQVVMTQESTVGDLITAAVQRYTKEERRPFLPTSTDPSCFDLHYSPFSLESLDRNERLIKLGSRNFFLCLDNCAVAPLPPPPSDGSSSSVTKITTTTTTSSSRTSSSSSSSSLRSSSCSNQVVIVEKMAAPNSTIDDLLPWLRFTQFMM